MTIPKPNKSMKTVKKMTTNEALEGGGREDKVVQALQVMGLWFAGCERLIGINSSLTQIPELKYKVWNLKTQFRNAKV
jgi:hypothetical protein